MPCVYFVLTNEKESEKKALMEGIDREKEGGVSVVYCGH